MFFLGNYKNEIIIHKIKQIFLLDIHIYIHTRKGHLPPPLKDLEEGGMGVWGDG